MKEGIQLGSEFTETSVLDILREINASEVDDFLGRYNSNEEYDDASFSKTVWAAGDE